MFPLFMILCASLIVWSDWKNRQIPLWQNALFAVACAGWGVWQLGWLGSLVSAGICWGMGAVLYYTGKCYLHWRKLPPTTIALGGADVWLATALGFAIRWQLSLQLWLWAAVLFLLGAGIWLAIHPRSPAPLSLHLPFSPALLLAGGGLIALSYYSH
ncbi:MAG TPA: prepilin peptidase [Anaerolineales bacterium]|nr:prepilin peptidase [Anaerolineales bacterium]